MQSNLADNVNSKNLLIGRINGIFGVQGWVKVFSYTQPRKNILSYKPWHIQVNAEWKTLEIINGREQSKTIVAKIKGIDTREDAQITIGTDIYIQKLQLPKLKEGEYYWQDLIGLEVVNRENITLGKVINLTVANASSVLIVKGEKEHWIPYVKPFLIKTSINKKQILVDWDKNF